MEPSGSTAAAVVRRLDVALLEQRLAHWKRMGVMAQTVTATIVAMTMFGMMLLGLADTPLKYYRAFAIPCGFVGLFGLVAIIGIALQITTIQEDIARLRKAS